jgi:S1-C subfamily serine protease
MKTVVKICGIEPNGIAARAGVLPGDVLDRINGHEIRDVLDYRFYLTDTRVTLSLLRDGTPL